MSLSALGLLESGSASGAAIANAAIRQQPRQAMPPARPKKFTK
jgi:hypothetical protein